MSRILAVILTVVAASQAFALEAATTPPLDLKAVCKIASENNPYLAGAEASVDVTRAKLAQAGTAYIPKFSVESRYSYINEETLFGQTPILSQDTIVHSASLSQTLFTSGEAEANIRAARHGVNANQNVYKATRDEIMVNAATAYFRTKQAREGIEVARRSVEALEASYDSAEKMRAEGVVTKSDVLRAEVALTSARESLIKANNDYEAALSQLKSVLGYSQSEEIQIAIENGDEITGQASTLDAAERAEVQAREEALLAAKAARDAASAQDKPKLMLVADYEWQPRGSEFPRRSDTFMVTVMAVWDVFDGGLTRAKVAEADASMRKAREELKNADITTEMQLATARLNYESAKARVETTKTQVKSAEESFRTLEIGYREGINNITDILNAETALSGARVSRVAAIYDLKISEVALIRALGQTDILLGN